MYLFGTNLDPKEMSSIIFVLYNVIEYIFPSKGRGALGQVGIMKFG